MNKRSLRQLLIRQLGIIGLQVYLMNSRLTTATQRGTPVFKYFKQIESNICLMYNCQTAIIVNSV